MTWLRAYWPLLAALALAAFVLGAPLTRCAPSERVEEEAAVELESHEEATERTEEAREVVRRVERREERRPDGSTVATEVEESREVAASVAVAVREAGARAAEEVRRVEARARPSWRIAALVGWSAARPAVRPELYGIEVSRRVAGPVWLGAWARTDKSAGLSLAAEWP